MANTAVFGIYANVSGAELAMRRFESSWLPSGLISVNFAPRKTRARRDFRAQKGTKAPEGTATGAASGAVIGGAGWMATGHRRVKRKFQSVGPFIAAGPIMAALAGIGVGGAVGGFTGALIGMGIPEYQAKRYEGLVKNGSILLSVHADDSKWAKLAKTVLDQTGATEISSTGESKGDYANSEKPKSMNAAL